MLLTNVIMPIIFQIQIGHRQWNMIQAMHPDNLTDLHELVIQIDTIRMRIKVYRIVERVIQMIMMTAEIERKTPHQSIVNQV